MNSKSKALFGSEGRSLCSFRFPTIWLSFPGTCKICPGSYFGACGCWLNIALMGDDTWGDWGWFGCVCCCCGLNEKFIVWAGFPLGFCPCCGFCVGCTGLFVGVGITGCWFGLFVKEGKLGAEVLPCPLFPVDGLFMKLFCPGVIFTGSFSWELSFKSGSVSMTLPPLFYGLFWVNIDNFIIFSKKYVNNI